MIDDPRDQPEPDGFALVIPFVICQSQGGPHEDRAFVAGYECGRFDHSLAAIAAVGGDRLTQTVRTDSVRQLELIAMHHGFYFGMIEHSNELPEWTTVTVVRSGGSAPRWPEGEKRS